MFEKDEYKFKLEQFAEKIGVGYFKLYISLRSLIYLLNAFILPLLIISISKNNSLWFNFRTELVWTTPAFFGNIITLFFLKLIRNKSIETLNQITVHLKMVEMVSNILRKIFQTWHHIIISLFFVLFSIFFQIKYLIITPWSHWQIWYEAESNLAFLLSFFRILATGYSYFFNFILVFTCVASCYMLYKIGMVLKEEIDVDKLETLKLYSIGRLSLIISISWIITLGPSLIIFIVAPLTWWTIMQAIGFLTISLFLFLVSTYSTHQTLIKMKRNAQEQIKIKIWDKYSEVIRAPPELKDIQNTLLQIQSLQIYEERIKNILSWPFDPKTVIEFISTFSVPVFSIVIKIIVESFLKR